MSLTLLIIVLLGPVWLIAMLPLVPCSLLKIGMTRAGKTLSAVRDILANPGWARVILDPHKESLAYQCLIHLQGNILYQNLSDFVNTLGFGLLTPSTATGEQKRREDQRKAEAFTAILLMRRDATSMAKTPLLEEYTYAVLLFFLSQTIAKPIEWLPLALVPGSVEFAAMLRDCTLPAIRYKFEQLAQLTPRGLRSEVGSTVRLIEGVFRSSAFTLRARPGFNLAAFLQAGGILIIEKGDDIGDDSARVVMGAIIILVDNHARRRLKPWPPIVVHIDEINNAALCTTTVERGLAETAKNFLGDLPLMARK